MEKIKERGKIYALHKASDKLNDYYGSAMLGVVQFDGHDIQCAYVDGYLQAEQHSEVKDSGTIWHSFDEVLPPQGSDICVYWDRDKIITTGIWEESEKSKYASKWAYTDDLLQEPTNPFDSHIQEGDKITVNEDGSRFNRSQLERVIAKQEEPVSEELEEELTNYFNKFKGLESSNWNWRIDSVNIHSGGLLDFARHFVEWQKQKMMKDAIEREVKVDAGGYPYIDATELYDYDNDKSLAKAGDRVKVVFIKDK